MHSLRSNRGNYLVTDWTRAPFMAICDLEYILSMKKYTIPEVAKILGVGVHAVYAMVRKGKLRATPGVILVTEHDLQRYLATRPKIKQVGAEEESFHPLIFQ